MAAQPRFGLLNHKLDGSEFTVPLLLDENRDPAHQYTNSLLRAAEIIAPKLLHKTVNLEVLVGEVEELVSPSEANGKTVSDTRGIIIEDEYGAGSIIVKKEEAVVALRDKTEMPVPTALFCSMLQAWVGVRNGQPLAIS